MVGEILEKPLGLTTLLWPGTLKATTVQPTTLGASGLWAAELHNVDESRGMLV